LLLKRPPLLQLQPRSLLRLLSLKHQSLMRQLLKWPK
jgi:hypothetical protein